MSTFLRLTGLGTAAVWLGGTVLFLFGINSLLDSSTVVRLLGPLHAGETGILATERFLLFQALCAGAALIHLLADWLYTGRPVDRRIVALLLLLLGLAFLSKLWIVPKCRALNMQAFLGPGRQVLTQAQTPAQRQAERSLALWGGFGIVLHVASLAGVICYFLHQSSGNTPGPRLFSRTKLRI